MNHLPRSLRIATLLYAGLTVAHVLAGLQPDPRTWGFHQLAFVSRTQWLVPSAFLLLLLVPRVAAHVSALAYSAGAAVFRRPLWLVLVAAVSGGLFYAFRMEFQFLGDGVAWLSALKHGRRFFGFEPFAATLTRFVAGQIAPQSPVDAAGFASILLGPVYVFATALLVRTTWTDVAPRTLAWILLLAHPLLILFFGYVEAYPLLIVCQVVVALVLTRAARSGMPLVVPVLVQGAVMITHVFALAWLPALVALVHVRRRERPVLERWTASVVACAFALGVTVVLLRAIGASPLAILRAGLAEPGLGGQKLAWMFSRDHLLDVVNEFALLLGPASVLLAWAWSRGVRVRDVARDPAWMPTVWLTVGPLLLSVFIQPRIGGARDWDLFLPLVLPMVLLAVETWRRATTGEGRTPARTGESARNGGATPIAATVPNGGAVVSGRALGLTWVASLAWLAVGLDDGRSAERLLVVQDPRGTFSNFARGYSNETLGIYYRDRNREAARDAWLRATQANPANARYFNNLGMSELVLNRDQEACAALERALELGMDEHYVLFNLGACARRARDLEAAESYYDKALEKSPERWQVLSERGLVRYQRGRPEAALEDLQQAARGAPSNADVHHRMALALAALGRLAEARSAWERTLELDPNHRAARSQLQALDARTPRE